MCIAAIIGNPKGVSLKNLNRMATQNPDGGGVAWVDGKHVRYKKGLTAKQVYDLQPTLPRPFFLHFRIATRGRSIPELTHPFPIGVKALDGKLEGIAPLGVLIHNGTWHGMGAYFDESTITDSHSDTQLAAYLVGTHSVGDALLEHVAWSNATMKCSVKGKADIVMRGNWHAEEGNHFSNFHWKPSKYPVYKGSYGNYSSHYDADSWLDDDSPYTRYLAGKRANESKVEPAIKHVSQLPDGTFREWYAQYQERVKAYRNPQSARAQVSHSRNDTPVCGVTIRPVEDSKGDTCEATIGEVLDRKSTALIVRRKGTAPITRGNPLDGYTPRHERADSFRKWDDEFTNETDSQDLTDQIEDLVEKEFAQLALDADSDTPPDDDNEIADYAG